MGRPKKEDQTTVLDQVLSCKVSREEKAQFRERVRQRLAELGGEESGATLTEAGYLRSLVLRDIKAIAAQPHAVEPAPEPAEVEPPVRSAPRGKRRRKP